MKTNQNLRLYGEKWQNNVKMKNQNLDKNIKVVNKKLVWEKSHSNRIINVLMKHLRFCYD